jgi:hypothetical protein
LEKNGDQVAGSCDTGSIAESKGKGTAHMQYSEGRVTGLVTWRGNCLLNGVVEGKMEGT